MKANEAPEKLYIDLFKGEFNVSYSPTNNSVEYTRTDAFIDKARKWFEKQNEWHDINGIKHCDMESFEDFRKYMGGE